MNNVRRLDFFYILYQINLVYVLFFLTVVALDDAVFFVFHMEQGLHGFVVGDTFGVVAFHDTSQVIGSDDSLFLYHFIIFDDVEYDIGGHHRETGYFFVGKETVLHLDDALVAQLFGTVVITDGDGGVQILQFQETDNLVSLVCGYVVDDSTILDGGHQHFFLCHNGYFNDVR